MISSHHCYCIEEGAFPDLIFSKFGIDIVHQLKGMKLHLSQLFLAMQYHTGVVFKDSNHYRLGSRQDRYPFVVDDILASSSPHLKTTFSYPCQVGSLLKISSALNDIELYADATNLLKLHVSNPSDTFTTPPYYGEYY
jgi:hypothetical protein